MDSKQQLLEWTQRALVGRRDHGRHLTLAHDATHYKYSLLTSCKVYIPNRVAIILFLQTGTVQNCCKALGNVASLFRRPIIVNWHFLEGRLGSAWPQSDYPAPTTPCSLSLIFLAGSKSRHMAILIPRHVKRKLCITETPWNPTNMHSFFNNIFLPHKFNRMLKFIFKHKDFQILTYWNWL